QSAFKEIEVTNGASPLTKPPEVSIKKDGNSCDQDCDFVVTENGCKDKLVASATCHVKVAFLPRHAGSVKQQLKVGDLVKVDLIGVGQNWGTPATRMVAGIDASAASSADTKQQFFVEAMLTAPLRLPHPSKTRSPKEDPLDSRLWVFANPK